MRSLTFTFRWPGLIEAIAEKPDDLREEIKHEKSMSRNWPLINRAYFFLLLSIITITSIACGPDVSQLFSRLRTPALATETGLIPPTATKVQRFTIAPTSITTNLDQLESYRARLVLDFEGTRSGQRSSGHIEAVTRINRNSSALHHVLNVEAIIPNTQAGLSEFFQIDRHIYIFRADETVWFETTAGRRFLPGDLGFLEPDKLVILPPTTANPPQSETLNGVDVQRYSFSEADLIDPNIIFKEAQGDLWVAPTSNYVMQYVISASLKIVRPLPGAHLLDEGSLNLRYTLADMNSNLTIRRPGIPTETNRSNLAAIPRLPNAEIVSLFPALIEYISAISSISATLFYRDELSALNWIEESSTIFNEKSNLVFSKAGQTLTILIIPDDNRAKIKILLDLKSSP